MKIVKSNKLYFKTKDEELLEYLQKQLTYEIIEHSRGDQLPRYHCMFGLVSKDVYWVPNTRLDLIDRFYKGEQEFTISDKRVSKPTYIPKPLFTPREDQALIIDEYSEDSILNGAPG